MNAVLTWAFLVLLMSASACGPDQATQWLETAQFEERQTNLYEGHKRLAATGILPGLDRQPHPARHL